jgi:2,3-bisphosphoglycerate-dependent phosphoglycerate mutase
MLYELDDELNSRGWEFVGDPEAAAKAAEAVANQAKG